MSIKIIKKSATRKATAKDSRKAGNVLNKTKKSVEKNPIDKEEKKEKEKKATPFLDRMTFAANLVLQQKFTDEEIKEMTDKKFPDYPGSPKLLTQKEMGRVRHMLRYNKLKAYEAKEPAEYQRLFKTDEGAVVPRAELPKKKRAKVSKVTEENDVLNNIAGINVHNKIKSKKSKTQQLVEKIQKVKK